MTILFSVGLAVVSAVTASPSSTPPASPDAIAYVMFDSPGSISGRVTDQKGTPVKDTIVRVFVVNMEKQFPGGGGKGESRSVSDARPIELQAKDRNEARFGKPIKASKTDADGKFTIDGLPPRTYRLVVGVPQQTSIYKAESVNVESGKATNIDVKVGK